jgi:hypothetical protein
VAVEEGPSLRVAAAELDCEQHRAMLMPITLLQQPSSSSAQPFPAFTACAPIAEPAASHCCQPASCFLDAEASSSPQLGEIESNRAASPRALGPEQQLPEL